MAYKLTFWSVKRRPASPQHPAFAFVYIKGEETHFGEKRTFKTESYNVPYDADPAKNTNEDLVKRAIALSQNKWNIPHGMNFKQTLRGLVEIIGKSPRCFWMDIPVWDVHF